VSTHLSDYDWIVSYWERCHAFLAAHPRLHCPACHKRVSPEMDTVGFLSDEGVTLVCPHCGVRSEVE
jgi:hypothetical protein